MLLRSGPGHGDQGLEVLMMRRSPEARVMPGIWVFPGGSVDPDDFSDARDEHHAFELAARRELHEESSIELAPEHELRPWSRWVTPEAVPVRFDTRFFVAKAPAHAKPVPDATEMTEAEWLAPAAALDAYEAGTIDLIFPTIMHLLMLARHAGVTEALGAAPSEPPAPVQPEIVSRGQETLILIDGVEYELPRTSSLEIGKRD
jgi:8-oxo-dGTP pyrophosphatase MutT (NUDIX family)